MQKALADQVDICVQSEARTSTVIGTCIELEAVWGMNGGRAGRQMWGAGQIFVPLW